MVTQGENTAQERSERLDGAVLGKCERCGAEYPFRAGKRFCGPVCRRRAWGETHERVFISPDGRMTTRITVK